MADAPYFQLPDNFGTPAAYLNVDHTEGSGELRVDECPFGVVLSGAKFVVTIGATQFLVKNIGGFPYNVWTQVEAIGGTFDDFYPSGTPVYLIVTREMHTDLRSIAAITHEDETGRYPESKTIGDISLSELGDRLHSYLTITENDHHNQFHNHSSESDSSVLIPKRFTASQTFHLTGDLSPSQITANQNDWEPTDSDKATVVYLTSDAARTITGMDFTQTKGRLLILINEGTFGITLSHQDTGSVVAANRFDCMGDDDLVIPPNGGWAITWYSGTRWRAALLGGGGGGAPAAHAASHAENGSDEILLEGLGTAETNTAKVPHPDGSGGVVWGTDEGGSAGATGEVLSAVPSADVGSITTSFVDICSLSVPAGDWLLMATVDFSADNTGTLFAKVWDGTTVWSENLMSTQNGYVGNIKLMSGKVTLGSTTTVKISAKRDAGTATVYKNHESNAATRLVAVQVGSAGMVTRGAYTSRPAAGLNGRIYLASDNPIKSFDTGSVWKEYYGSHPLENDGFPTTWVNQGTSTYSLTDGGLYLAGQAAAGDSVRLLEKNAPTPPYTIIAGVVFNMQAVNNGMAGLAFRQSSDGKLHAILMHWATDQWRLLSGKYNSATSYSADYQEGFLPLADPIWFKIQDDNTNRKVSYSRDGVHFRELHSVGRTDFLTADKVGLFVNPVNASHGPEAWFISWKQS